MEASNGLNGTQLTGSLQSEKSDSMPLSLPVFATVGGEGEASYSQNSRLQALLGGYLQPILKQSLLELTLPPASGSIYVADFGCSVGANTIAYAKLIAESLKTNQAYSDREIFYLFTDLPSNDFNTLFNQLPPFLGQGGGNEERTWFAAGVPGSQFYKLFPRASLHVVISTFALFYLSEIPKAVLDKPSAAYNKGRIWIEGASPAVAEAYAEASRACLRTFFELRAHELAPGGLLAVHVICRKHRNHPEKQFPDESMSPFSAIEQAWDELVKEGVMDAEVRDSFNIPLCYPSVDELQEAIELTSAFHIQKLQIYEKVRCSPGSSDDTRYRDAESYGKLLKITTKSSMSSMVRNHIGPDLTEKLFDRVEQVHTMAYPGLKAKYELLPERLPFFMSFCIAILIRK